MAHLTLHPNKNNKAYTATGINPKTGKKITIHGGILSDDDLEKVSKKRVDNFMNRFGIPKTPKQYINALRWQRDVRIGESVEVPDFLF